MAEATGEIGRRRFGLAAAWLVAVTGAILLWVGVAALAPRAERGLVVSLDASSRTLTLEPARPGGPGLRTFAVQRNVSVQRFDEGVSLKDVRPEQWLEMSVRTTPGAVPTVTSIRIIREEPGSVSARVPGAASQ